MGPACSYASLDLSQVSRNGSRGVASVSRKETCGSPGSGHWVSCARLLLGMTETVALLRTPTGFGECMHNARRIRSMHRPLSERIWCSQSRMTVQSAVRSRRKFRWSRFLFSRNFNLQKCDSLCSHAGSRHPCQKSPSMKIATFSLGKTMSGVPCNLL